MRMQEGKWYKGYVTCTDGYYRGLIHPFLFLDNFSGLTTANDAVMPLHSFILDGNGYEFAYNAHGVIFNQYALRNSRMDNVLEEIPDPFNGKVRHYSFHFEKERRERLPYMWLSRCGRDVGITTDNPWLVTCKHCLSLMGLPENYRELLRAGRFL